jgi:hypothetical protein
MTRWLDFSGAPPILVPLSLVQLWRGAVDASSGHYADLNTENPKTDYDRACLAAWPGRGLIEVGKGLALVLYTEWDQVSWNPASKIVACGGWWPRLDQFESAHWIDPLRWSSDCTDYLLMNSAADGLAGLRPDDFVNVQLPRGECVVEYAQIEADYIGGFHRFTLLAFNGHPA